MGFSRLSPPPRSQTAVPSPIPEHPSSLGPGSPTFPAASGAGPPQNEARQPRLLGANLPSANLRTVLRILHRNFTEALGNPIRQADYDPHLRDEGTETRRRGRTGALTHCLTPGLYPTGRATQTIEDTRPGPATFHPHLACSRPAFSVARTQRRKPTPLQKQRPLSHLPSLADPWGPRLARPAAGRNHDHVTLRSWPEDLPSPLQGDIIEQCLPQFPLKSELGPSYRGQKCPPDVQI